jgi:NAD/NADP transhydrogenase beta subunit
LLDFVQKWKDKISNLVETKFRLLQLEFIERASGVMSFLVLSVLLLLLGFGVFLFIGLGVAEMLSEMMKSYISGYMAVAGFYLVLLLTLFALRKKIIRKFTGIFISVMTERREDDEEEGSEEKDAK